MTPGTIIVGAGQAGGECAVRLRQLGYEKPITLVGTEAHLPYQRPPLSKAFLSGDVTEAALLLRPAAFYQNQNIDFLGSTTVAAIDRPDYRIILAHGQAITYEKLVLATGGHARRLSCLGAKLPGVFYLRTLDDVLALRGQLQAGSRLAIIGGGYVGLEVAAVATKLGVKVTLIESAPRVLARVAGQEISAFYEQAHRDAGVDIHTSATLNRILPAAGSETHVGGIELEDGYRFDADFVLAGIGLIPHTELAEAAGLHVENGIWVDTYGVTADPDILAAGDCANQPSAFLGRRLRLESVPNAIEQARVAAQAIIGKPVAYNAIPWFWSDQYDLKLQAVGLSEGHDQVVLRGAMQDRAFTAFYLRQGRLIAADSVNRPADFMAAKRLVGATLGDRAPMLADIALPLKDLLPKAA
jgi:3-phenylpropionate/trans-cinnamate dioxygenase ferredoxin reductase subunit